MEFCRGAKYTPKIAALSIPAGSDYRSDYRICHRRFDNGKSAGIPNPPGTA